MNNHKRVKEAIIAPTVVVEPVHNNQKAKFCNARFEDYNQCGRDESKDARAV